MDSSGGHDGASPMAASEQTPHLDAVPTPRDPSPVDQHVLEGFFDVDNMFYTIGDEEWYMLNMGEYGYVDSYDRYVDTGFGAVPTSSKAIAGLEEAAAGEIRETECPICLENFKDDDKIRKMPCSHAFHESCIFEWLRISCVCPSCRFKLSDAHDDDVSLLGNR